MPTSSSSPSGNTGRNRPPGETSEARIAKALAHPLRARILQRLGERVASPGDLAVELDAPLGVVSYHVRMLRDYDCVELVRTEPRRGALDDAELVLSRTPLELDDKAFKKLNKLLAKTHEQALSIAAESAARGNGAADGVFPTELAV